MVLLLAVFLCHEGTRLSRIGKFKRMLRIRLLVNDMEGSAIQTAILATNAASLGLGKLAGNTVTFIGQRSLLDG